MNVNTIYITIVSTLLLYFIPPAQAQIIECGTPQSVSVSTNPNAPVCDIYTRQLTYRKEAEKLKTQIEERTANFAIPSRQARENYKKNLQALHDSYK